MAHKGVGESKLRFSRKFFPSPPPDTTTSTGPNLTSNPFEELANADSMTESDLNDKFVELVNKHNLIPGLKMTSCEKRPDPVMIDDDRQKPDSAIYLAEDAPADGTPCWANQLIPVEFKTGKGTAIQDPFMDVPGGVQPAIADHRTRNRAQIISYAECLFAVQQRLAVFMLLVIGRRARFIRWDRSGSIVTTIFDYYLHWRFFVDVLWRIAHCSAVLLGLDPTARRLSPNDPLYALMTEFAAPHEGDVDHKERFLSPHEVSNQPFVFKYVRDAFRQSLVENWPRYCVEVPNGEERRRFLICKPHFRAKGLAGRGTRGYVALDCETKRFVWLKDAWRAHYVLVDREGDILQRLKAAKVPRVPNLVCHGDIDDQVTLTPQWWEEKNQNQNQNQNQNPYPTPLPSHYPAADAHAGSSSSASNKRKFTDDEQHTGDVPPPEGLADSQLPFRDDCPLRRHKHYRLVEEEIALPLNEFGSGKQLIQIVRDCVLAHFHAVKDAKLLHRDISAGNILIYPKIVCVKDPNVPHRRRFQIKFTGLLADWEMAKPIDTEQKQRQPERTGTWQYMSVALLSHLKTNVETCDELESFYYVVLHHAVRYLKSNFDELTVANYIDEFFDQYGYVNNQYTCGDKKLGTILNGRLLNSETQLEFACTGVNMVLERILSWFHAYHIVAEYDRPAPAAPTTSSPTSSHTPPPPPPRPPTPPSPTGSVFFTEDEINFEYEEEDEFEDDGATSIDIPVLERKSAPTAQERQLASLVVTHEAMLKFLKDALEWDAVSWANGEKVGDRVPTTWRPDKKTKASAAAGTSNKKLKLDEDVRSEPIFRVPLLPARFPKTPPRPGHRWTPSPTKKTG
ncbi:hypothetical protein L226DRAFT_617315 [Lentinus tigrinus ALCF2SS1-7]|uniref:Fungal-type protein kinase domain-containing protein n=1 Tax=Lentinus tigrinus ALCF2SS1-6 TaxID=1328759 RepID=A0A5C2S877_9APHY|nr:hypothetical protein L227DRAFT_549070 [Lentinus tigrinus ALCF2SS1-6]RPD68753.1 hypothetical protein L226DRAFT_617315 [Lentinus tigrinus ALCF2SS1-7]